MNIKTYKPKVLLDVLLAVLLAFACVLGGIIFLVPIVFGILRTINNFGIGFGFLLSSAGIVLSVLWIGLLFVLIFALKIKIKMLNLSIRFEDDRIVVKCGRFENHISKQNISYILKGGKGIMLIWQIEGTLKTFFVRRYYFKRKSYLNFVANLTKLNGYCEDQIIKEKIRKDNHLDHIFRKNKLELEL